MPTLRAALALLSVAAAPAFAGEPSKAAPGHAQPALPAPGVVDGATAHRLVEAGVKVVDVRTPGEFAAGHVPGAVNIPYDEIERRREELGPPTTPLLLYCHSGRRSGLAAAALRAHGYERLYDLQAYTRWSEAGR